MTELIVALDAPTSWDNRRLLEKLVDQTPVRFFKLGVAALMSDRTHLLIDEITNRYRIRSLDQCARLMLDLKVYDTRDTVARVVHRAFEIGAHMVTVHATPSVMGAAMAAKVRATDVVLAVPHLTDQHLGRWSASFSVGALEACDGIVCPASIAAHHRSSTCMQEKLLVVPGIRPQGSDADNHRTAATPGEAIRAGATHVVVGRPIWQSPDPVAATLAILEEMS